MGADTPRPRLDIQEESVEDLAGYITLLAKYSPAKWVFRGQTDFEKALFSKAGRPEFHSSVGLINPAADLARFEDWRMQAVAYFNSLPADDFECLALAQHYGLATRLLDWSTNPLVALYFAVESEPKCKGVVYCYYTEREITENKFAAVDPVKSVALYRPRPIDRRIVAQSGVFTYHPKPSAEFEVDEVEKYYRGGKTSLNLYALTIEASHKEKLMKQLGEVGMTRKALFPDLEGLSSFINWGTRVSVERTARFVKELAKL